MNITWDAEGYRERFSFVHQYGEDVLKLIEAPQGKRVVDLGCGNGALTQKLAELGCQVVGIDASKEMLAVAQKQYPQLSFRLGNALDFQLERKAQVIFSNAVFHWIDEDKQDAMLEHIASQLETGGQLVCEFGGKGCAEAVHSTLETCFAKRGLHYPRVFYFPSIGEYAPMLERQGLKVEYAVLFNRPTLQQGEQGLHDWICMFVKEPFRGMDEEMKEAIIREAQQLLEPILTRDGKWYIDYVRIRIRARKQ